MGLPRWRSATRVAPTGGVASDPVTLYGRTALHFLARILFLGVVGFPAIALTHEHQDRALFEKSFQAVPYALSAGWLWWLSTRAADSQVRRYFDASLFFSSVSMAAGSFAAFAVCRPNPERCSVNHEFTTFQSMMLALGGLLVVVVGQQRVLSALAAGLVRSALYVWLVAPHVPSDVLRNDMSTVVVPSILVLPLAAMAQQRSIQQLFTLYQEKAVAEKRASDAEHSRAVLQRWLFHEMRVPMNSVILGVDNLAEDHGDDECVQEVRKSCGKVARVLRTMLLQAHIEEGSLVLNRTHVDFTSFSRTHFTKAAEHARRRGLGFSWAMPPVRMFVDVERISLVLATLLRNAMQYTKPPGSISVHAEVDAQARVLRVEVADTGAGISEEGQRHVFEAYHQIDADQHTGKDAVTTGLNVAISNQIVRAHGGRMWVRSALGHGSTFGFELPLLQGGDSAAASSHGSSRSAGPDELRAAAAVAMAVAADQQQVPDSGGGGKNGGRAAAVVSGATAVVLDTDDEPDDAPTKVAGSERRQSAESAAAAAASAAAAAAAAAESAAEAHAGADEPSVSPRTAAVTRSRHETVLREALGGLSVLVVEDSLPSWKMLRMFLKRYGASRVEHAPNGALALELVEQCGRMAFDLIIMDKEMPVMAGVECTRELRRRGVQCRIFGLTGSVMDIHEFKEAGLDAVLSKPLDKDALAVVLASRTEFTPESMSVSSSLSRQDSSQHRVHRLAPRQRGADEPFEDAIGGVL